jgi:hypothetical protein
VLGGLRTGYYPVDHDVSSEHDAELSLAEENLPGKEEREKTVRLL